MRIFNTNYNIEGVRTNIVLIADIHYYSKCDIKHLNKILDNIKKTNPNFICISGDLLDQSKILDEECIVKWLIKLSSISKVIVSIGNHEFYINRNLREYGLNKELFNKIRKINNLYLLDNENVVIDKFNFIGITLPMEYYAIEDTKNVDMTKYLDKIKTDKNCYNILLCHSPINICNEELLKRYNIDLILCGHTHGGIVPKILRPIIKNGGFISPRKKLFIKTAYGHLKIYNTDIIITSGVTVISHINKFRILKNLFSSEIVNINIESSIKRKN